MKCLIVDDSKMSRLMVKKIIQSSYPDWEIIEACDGQEAIDVAQGEDFNIIFVDYNMPGMNGGEAAKVLRPLFPDAKIAFLTANIQGAIVNEAKELKIDFIPKPILEERIIKYVR